MDGFPEDTEPEGDEADDQETFYIPEELMSEIQFDWHTKCLNVAPAIEPS